MDRPRSLSICCLLLLSLQLVALAVAVPSCTDYQTLRLRPEPPSAPEAPPPLSRWAAIRRFVFDLYDAYRPLRFSSPVSFEKSISEPSPPKALRLLRARYGDQLVLRFNVSTPLEVSSLSEASNTLFLDIWGQSGNWVDIRLAKDAVPALLGLLPSSLQHSHKPLVQGSDLVRAIAETYPPSSPSSGGRRQSRAFNLGRRKSADGIYSSTESFFDDYRPLTTIDTWMSQLDFLFSSHVEKISIGQTYENRTIPALRVGRHPTGRGEPRAKRKTVLVSGGQHAREWISTSTVLFIAHSLITVYNEDPIVTELLDSMDFVFIPTLNPDGYEYTWQVDRLWRKNRQETTLPFCRGLDLDRSWAFKWDGERTRDNPCSESFAGEAPFEAVESLRFAEWARDEIENNDVDLVGLLDLHSYSQQILYPFSYSCTSYPPTLENLQELGQGLAKSIRFVSREHYQVKSACEGNVAASGEILPRLEAGGGSALDWFYHELNVRKAFQIKLRDKGSYGFLLPREHIVPTGLEILNLVKHLARVITTDSVAGVEYASTNGAEQSVLTASDA